MARSFCSPRRRVAVQQRVTLLVEHALDLDRHLAGRLHLGGERGIELALAQPRHHHVVIALGPQPRQVGLGRDTGIHHHRGTGRCAQAAEHLLQRGGLAGIASEDPTATREPAAVQRHGQGHQRAVAAALLAVPAPGLAHACGHALEVGVGEVIQGDRLAEAEDRLRLREQVVLQGLAMLVQRVRGAVQAVQIHRLEVEADQLTERRALLQPRVRRELTAWMGHAADDVAHGRGNLRAVQAELGELVLEPALAHHRQRRMLDPHAARAHQIERVEIDLLVSPRLARVRLGRFTGRDACSRGPQRNQLRRIALRQGVARLGHRRIEQGALTLQQLIDAPGKRRPLLVGQIEVAAQVEQRGLPDGAADPRSLDQAVGRVGLAGRAIAGLGTPDEHLSMLHEIAASGSSLTKYYGTTFHFWSDPQHPCGLAADEIGKWAKS